MSPVTAEMIVTGAGFYLAVGVVVGLLYVTLLLKRSSAGAQVAAPVQFRILIFPACVVLWPYVLMRGLIGGAKSEDPDAPTA